MKTYTLPEARQSLPAILDQAQEEGAVAIRREDGHTFVVKPETPARSPLDVPGVDLGITTDEIVGFVREGRRGKARP
jgi:hypothetical protein